MRKSKKFFALALAFSLGASTLAQIAPAAPVSVYAATTAEAPALSATKATVVIGDTMTLTYSNVDAAKVSKVAWSSNKTSIAKVSAKGVVTPVKAGSATISCKITFKDKTTKTLKCAVTVVKRVAATKVEITNAKLNKSSQLEVGLGQTFKLATKLTPAKATDKIYWVTSSSKIATVSADGTITGIKTGTCTIAAKAGLNEKTATASSNKIVAKVKVKVVLIPATKVTITNAKLNKSSQFELLLGNTYKLLTKITPVNTTDKLFWVTSNAKIAKIDENGVLTGVKAGTCTIAAKMGQTKAKATASTNKVVAKIKVKVVNPATAEMTAIKKAKFGDVVTFGMYEQDNDLDNGAEALEWYVIRTDDEEAILLSKYVIDSKSYNKGWNPTNWSESGLREWLNGDFYKSAFNATEKGKIAEVENSDHGNYLHNSGLGAPNTLDKVFLLSFSDASTYLNFNPTVYQNLHVSESTEIVCAKPTQYALANGASTASKIGNDGIYSWWWLRTAGNGDDRAMYVDDIAQACLDGRFANTDSIGVRPVIVVKLK